MQLVWPSQVATKIRLDSRTALSSGPSDSWTPSHVSEFVDGERTSDVLPKRGRAHSGENTFSATTQPQSFSTDELAEKAETRSVEQSVQLTQNLFKNLASNELLWTRLKSQDHGVEPSMECPCPGQVTVGKRLFRDRGPWPALPPWGSENENRLQTTTRPEREKPKGRNRSRYI